MLSTLKMIKYQRTGFNIFILLFCMMFIASCKEEEYVYPSVLTEFVDIQTNGNGKLNNIITDNGKSYYIRQRSDLEGFTADSIYRTLSVYLPENGSEYATLYSCQFVLSMKPTPRQDFKTEIKTDPLDIERIWQSGKYINMVLTVQAKDKGHGFNFIEEGIEENSDGSKTLSITLFHNQNDDYKAFSRNVYLSVPLWAYNGLLHNGDKVEIRINTFEEGVTSRIFEFPEN